MCEPGLYFKETVGEGGRWEEAVRLSGDVELGVR